MIPAGGFTAAHPLLHCSIVMARLQHWTYSPPAKGLSALQQTKSGPFAMTPATPRTPAAAPARPTLVEAAKATPAYFAPEPAGPVKLRELSALDQMYGYYDAA